MGSRYAKSILEYLSIKMIQEKTLLIQSIKLGLMMSRRQINSLNVEYTGSHLESCSGEKEICNVAELSRAVGFRFYPVLNTPKGER